MTQISSTALATDPNLQAYWKLEDETDSSPNARTLTNHGTTLFVPGKYANCADLGASNGSKWFSTSNNVGVAGGGPVAISLWVKLQSEITTSIYELFRLNMNVSADRLFLFDYEYNGGSQRLALDYSNGPGKAYYSVTMGTNRWFHMVGQCNPGAVLDLYVNGVLVASGTTGTETGGAVNSFGLGASPAGGAYSSVLIDDVGVFNRLLTQAEITTLASDGGGGGLFALM